MGIFDWFSKKKNELPVSSDTKKSQIEQANEKKIEAVDVRPIPVILQNSLKDDSSESCEQLRSSANKQENNENANTTNRHISESSQEKTSERSISGQEPTQIKPMSSPLEVASDFATPFIIPSGRLTKEIADKFTGEIVDIPYGYESIDASAFHSREDLVKITIPSSITAINCAAFKQCKSLKSIVIPEGVTSIEISTFEGCSSLESIEIPNSVTSIGFASFDGCTNLTSVSMSNNVNNIGFCAFRNCKKLTSAVISGGITKIEKYVFENCANITIINIPENVKEIDERAFYGCKSIKSINIPKAVTSIGKYCFSKCVKLESINISEGVISIGPGCFQDCAKLKSITLPNSISKIGAFTFAACKRMKSITIPNSVSKIEEYAFLSCVGLESITISNNIKKIPDSMFSNCNKLSDVIIPDGITSIGSDAFYNCLNLMSVSIPKGVINIGTQAFFNCSNLSCIAIPDSVTKIGKDAFWKSDDNVILTIICSKDSYASGYAKRNKINTEYQDGNLTSNEIRNNIIDESITSDSKKEKEIIPNPSKFKKTSKSSSNEFEAAGRTATRIADLSTSPLFTPNAKRGKNITTYQYIFLNDHQPAFEEAFPNDEDHNGYWGVVAEGELNDKTGQHTYKIHDIDLNLKIDDDDLINASCFEDLKISYLRPINLRIAEANGGLSVFNNFYVYEINGPQLFDRFCEIIDGDYDVAFSPLKTQIKVHRILQFGFFLMDESSDGTAQVISNRCEYYTIEIPGFNKLIGTDYRVEIQDEAISAIYEMVANHDYAAQKSLYDQLINLKLEPSRLDELNWYCIAIAGSVNPKIYNHYHDFFAENFYSSTPFLMDVSIINQNYKNSSGLRNAAAFFQLVFTHPDILEALELDTADCEWANEIFHMDLKAEYYRDNKSRHSQKKSKATTNAQSLLEELFSGIARQTEIEQLLDDPNLTKEQRYLYRNEIAHKNNKKQDDGNFAKRKFDLSIVRSADSDHFYRYVEVGPINAPVPDLYLYTINPDDLGGREIIVMLPENGIDEVTSKNFQTYSYHSYLIRKYTDVDANVFWENRYDLRDNMLNQFYDVETLVDNDQTLLALHTMHDLEGDEEIIIYSGFLIDRKSGVYDIQSQYNFNDDIDYLRDHTIMLLKMMVTPTAQWGEITGTKQNKKINKAPVPDRSIPASEHCDGHNFMSNAATRFADLKVNEYDIKEDENDDSFINDHNEDADKHEDFSSSDLAVSGCIAIACSGDGALGLARNGIIHTTFSMSEDFMVEIASWKEIVALAGNVCFVGLKKDGTVVIAEMTDIDLSETKKWRHIKAVAAGFDHVVGLKQDGTVVATGKDYNGQCRTQQWANIIKIAAGFLYTIGINEDNKVLYAGPSQFNDSEASKWVQIIDVSCGGTGILGLKMDGSVVAIMHNDEDIKDNIFNISSWRNIISVAAGYEHFVGLRKDGSVVATGGDFYEQCNVEEWRDIIAIAAGSTFTLGLKRDGSVVGTGEYGELVEPWNNIGLRE